MNVFRPARWLAPAVVIVGLLAGCASTGASAAPVSPTTGAAASSAPAPSAAPTTSGSSGPAGSTRTTGQVPATSSISEPPGALDPTSIDPLPTPSPQLPTTVTGADGVQTTVTSIDRVVAVSQSGTVAEIVATLGLAGNLAGRDIAATFTGTEHVPVVTQAHDLATEPVLALDPTLLLIDESVGPPEVITQLRDAGVPVVVVPDAWTLEDIEPRITAVAAALGVPKAGAQLVERTKAQIAAAGNLKPPGSAPVRVAFLYLRGTAGVYLMAGDGSGADSMIEAIGAEDAGTAIGIEKFRPITSEGLIAAGPDVLLLMSKGLDSVGGMDGLLKVPGIAQTPAGQHRRVVTMDDSILLSFGPRTGEVITQLAREVYAAAGS